MSRRAASVALAVLFAGAVVLVAVELAVGAAGAGSLAVRDPCEPRPAFPGEGPDATLQRIVLDGLDGAACELGTTREELVLSLSPRQGGSPIRWDDATIERAVRAGLLEAIDDAEGRGSLNAIFAELLRQLVELGPIEWLVRGGQGLAELFG